MNRDAVNQSMVGCIFNYIEKSYGEEIDFHIETIRCCMI